MFQLDGVFAFVLGARGLGREGRPILDYYSSSYLGCWSFLFLLMAAFLGGEKDVAEDIKVQD